MSTKRLELGQRGEQMACQYLQSLGYEIEARNFRTPQGEVDIVAREQGVLCFVEVRTLTSAALTTPLETITRPKQLRLLRAASRYLQQEAGDYDEVRFDAVGVVVGNGDPQIQLVRGAFER